MAAAVLVFVDDRLEPYPYIADMTPSDFCDWLKAMNISSAEAARLLGVNANTVTRYKQAGASQVVALACSALYHRLEGWK
jgi:hypothetical protein